MYACRAPNVLTPNPKQLNYPKPCFTQKTVRQLDFSNEYESFVAPYIQVLLLLRSMLNVDFDLDSKRLPQLNRTTPNHVLVKDMSG